MKKTYEKPTAEKMMFNYRDQVVAASGANNCQSVWVHTGDESCKDQQHQEKLN